MYECKESLLTRVLSYATHQEQKQMALKAALSRNTKVAYQDDKIVAFIATRGCSSASSILFVTYPLDLEQPTILSFLRLESPCHPK